MVIGRKQRTPTFSDVFYKVLSSFELDLHVALPGRVTAYNNSDQLVDVILGIKSILTTDEGEPQEEELPVLYDIPVVFPRSKEFFISFPLSAGDFVLVIFNERPMDQWIERAGEQVPASGVYGDPVAPGLRSMHDLNGAVAIPGLFPSKLTLSETSSSYMVIGKEGGQQISIEATSGEVHIGENGSSDLEFVALANLVLSELQSVKGDLDSIQTWLASHVHTGVTTGPGSSGVPPPTPPPPTAHTPSSVASDNLKAED